MVSGLSPTASMAWHCAQCRRANLKPRRSAGDCARADSPAHNRIAPSDILSLGSGPNDFRPFLTSLSSGGSLSRQCRERRGVWAIFLPSRIGRILRELVLAPPFASTDRAYPLKFSHDLRVGVRDFLPVELELVHPPVQQIRRVRPFAGENGEIGSAHAHVAGDAFHLGRTATVKVHHRPASAVPASPPMREQATKAGPFTCLSRARHSSLHANSSDASLRVEPTQGR